MGLASLSVSASVRLSVCLSCMALDSKMKRCRKTKIDVNVLQGRSNWCADFQS